MITKTQINTLYAFWSIRQQRMTGQVTQGKGPRYANTTVIKCSNSQRPIHADRVCLHTEMYMCST